MHSFTFKIQTTLSFTIFEFELHDVITTELNDGHLQPDEIKRYRNLGYDVEESK